MREIFLSVSDMPKVLVAVDRQAQALLLTIKAIILICIAIAWLFFKYRQQRFKKMTDEQLRELAMDPANHNDLEHILKLLRSRGVSIKFIRPVIVELLKLGGEHKRSAWDCLGAFYPKLRNKIRRKSLGLGIHDEGWELLGRFARSADQSTNIPESTSL